MKKVFDVALWAFLYFVAFLAAEAVGFAHPFFYLYFCLLAAVLCAWPYVKLTSRHPVPGMSLVAVAFLLILFIIAGEVNEIKLFFVWGGLLLALISEIVRYLVKDGKKAIVLSYLPMSLIPFTTTWFMWASPTHMHDEMLEELPLWYADTMVKLCNGWLEAGMIVVTLCLAYFCAKFFVNKSVKK